MKFLERAKSYTGVPYAKKYHEPGSKCRPFPPIHLFPDGAGMVTTVSGDNLLTVHAFLRPQMNGNVSSLAVQIKNIKNIEP